MAASRAGANGSLCETAISRVSRLNWPGFGSQVLPCLAVAKWARSRPAEWSVSQSLGNSHPRCATCLPQRAVAMALVPGAERPAVETLFGYGTWWKFVTARRVDRRPILAG